MKTNLLAALEGVAGFVRVQQAVASQVCLGRVKKVDLDINVNEIIMLLNFSINFLIVFRHPSWCSNTLL